jgi:hypothetical protein
MSRNWNSIGTQLGDIFRVSPQFNLFIGVVVVADVVATFLFAHSFHPSTISLYHHFPPFLLIFSTLGCIVIKQPMYIVEQQIISTTSAYSRRFSMFRLVTIESAVFTDTTM